MPRDPIIPPMDLKPEELARRLMQRPKKEGKEQERQTPKTRRFRRPAASPASPASQSDPDT